jgi:hypothetical protein
VDAVTVYREVLRAFLALAIATVAWGQAQPQSAVLTAERTAGPFAVSDRSFHAVFHLARIPDATDPDFQETVASIEIRDQDGALHFERKLPYRLEAKRFDETTGVDAALVQGKLGSGLLLTYGVLPSTPMGGRTWQVLGMVEGKLRTFSAPVALEGGLLEEAPGKPVRASWDSALGTDVLNFRVWTGRFFIIVPLAVNWEWGYFRPAYLSAKGRWNVEAERRPRAGQASVRLHPQAGEKAGEAEEMALTPGAKVEFLGAEGDIVWEESEDQIWLGVSESIWLRVRIDGKEGWLHEPEDFDAVGLPEAG